MQSSLITPEIIDNYLAAGHWTRETMIDRYRAYAADIPDWVACCDHAETYSWAELDVASDHVAACLIDLGLARDATALVQISSTCREIVLRVAFKKAGIIGVFTPLQWRRRELDYVRERVDPDLAAIAGNHTDDDTAGWLEENLNKCIRVDVAETPRTNWIGWKELVEKPATARAIEQLGSRAFRFDEVSVISASSGTSGLAKLCGWPEGAQVCKSRVLCERMEITGEDKVGIFAPTAGAAGFLPWMMSWTVPCTTIFPNGYKASTLLDLVEERGITVGSTVPVILVRLGEELLESRNLQTLRLLRVGTAAADLSAAKSFEDRSGCRIVVASGAVECPGFGHAHVNERKELRLNGSVGLPLEGCRLRISDGHGAEMPAGTSGELLVTAPFASSGYWRDPEATSAVWSDGWYSTGDVGVLDENGRLTLLGRLKDTINRSGHKILPAEVEHEIAQLPEVFECSVVAAPDREYGQVPWAFIQMRDGNVLDDEAIAGALRDSGLAGYKIPVRFLEVDAFPRINDNKIDKKALLQTIET